MRTGIWCDIFGYSAKSLIGKIGLIFPTRNTDFDEKQITDSRGVCRRGVISSQIGTDKFHREGQMGKLGRWPTILLLLGIGAPAWLMAQVPGSGRPTVFNPFEGQEPPQRRPTSPTPEVGNPFDDPAAEPAQPGRGVERPSPVRLGSGRFTESPAPVSVQPIGNQQAPAEVRIQVPGPAGGQQHWPPRSHALRQNLRKQNPQHDRGLGHSGSGQRGTRRRF